MTSLLKRSFSSFAFAFWLGNALSGAAKAETYAVVDGIEVGDAEVSAFLPTGDSLGVLRQMTPAGQVDGLESKMHDQAVIEAVTLVAVGEAARLSGVEITEDDIVAYSFAHLPPQSRNALTYARKWNAELANDLDGEDKIGDALGQVVVDWKHRPDMDGAGVPPP